MNKIKNVVLIFVIFIASFSLVCCNKVKENPEVIIPNQEITGDTYKVTWENYDGSVLETDLNFIKDEIPHTKGKRQLNHQQRNTNIFLLVGHQV